MGVCHRGAGNEVGAMNRCSVICKAGRALSPLRCQLRLFYPRHLKRPGMPTLSRVPVRLTPRGRAYDLRAFAGLGLQVHHLPGDHCVQVIFDQAEAVHMSGMSENAYIRSSNGLQNSLGVKTTLDVCELGIQFDCVRLIPFVHMGFLILILDEIREWQ